MINSDQGRRVFALEVGGLLYRYHSGGGVTGLSTTIAPTINYQDIEAIVEVSSVSSSLDIAGGVGQYSATTVTLSVDRRRGELVTLALSLVDVVKDQQALEHS